MNRRTKAAIILISLFSTLVYAEKQESKTFPETRSTISNTEYEPHLGLLFGIVNPSVGNTTTEAGIDAGFQPYVPFGFGFEFSRTDDVTIALAKGTYNFGGKIFLLRHSYVGVAAGDNAGFIIGPLAGFDVPLSGEHVAQPLSLGASAKYLFSKNDRVQALTVNAILKYWF